MQKRFVTIWFRYLKTDWFTIRQRRFHNVPFVLASPDHGRMIITEANPLAQAQGINIGMALADARTIIPSLLFFDDKPELSVKLLKTIGEWCIRFTPIVSIDLPDGLILDATGCAHLWGGDEPYLKGIIMRLKNLGYNVRASLADTIGSSWAIAHFGRASIIKPREQMAALLPLPSAALRLEQDILERLQKLLEMLCHRLQQEQKGLRMACFKCYRIDGKLEKIDIGTNRASNNIVHLFKLFELKISSIEPALGIELFILEASKVEDALPVQEKLWERACGLDDVKIAELMDHLANKIGTNNIHRYLPDEHYWPERSVKPASSINDKADALWRSDKLRPIQLLSKPEPIEVTAPIPDYPPMLFRYKNKLHKIKKADGPERIEREWWLEEGPHRDYYRVEDEDGCRYWLFRSGHYTDKTYQWFIHGFFA